MKISTAFPSKYLKAADLDGKTPTVIINKVILEQVTPGADQQPVVFFKGHTKGLVLNRINAKKITEVYGDDTDNWIGGEIVLFEAMVDFRGDTVAALRVRHVPARQDSRFAQAVSNKEQDSQVGSQVSSLLVEAEAMTKQGINAFRDWRDRLSPDEFQAIHPHVGRLVELANGVNTQLSEHAKRLLKKGDPQAHQL